MKKFCSVLVLSLVVLSTLTLFQNCGSGGGSGGGEQSAASADWWYHFDCNGDPGCLSTNFAGSTYGDTDLGPVYANCASLLTFANINWNAPANNWCDHSPHGSVGGGGTGGLGAPTFSSMASSSGAPGITFLQIYGTNFGSTLPNVTAMYCGKSIQVTYVSPGTVTVKIPYMASCKSPITLTTPAGSVNTTPFTVLNNFRAVAASGSNIVVTGDYGTIMTSINGTTWTPRASGVSLSINCNLYTVNWNGSQFMAGGDNLYNLRSTDGNNWSELHKGGILSYESIIWTGTQYVAGGSGGIMQTSPDGGTWTNGSAPQDIYFGIAYNGSVYVAAAQGGVTTSGDASNWTMQVPAVGVSRNAVVWTGSAFWVVGNQGVVNQSSDGINWLNSNSGQSFDLKSLAWDGSKIVAVGKSGTILTYAGIGGWQVRSSGTSEHLYGVTWTGTLFVAVGAKNTIITSPDGATWTVRNAF